jgi:predicted 2-oxoglutarate/Fe(II)-dependent dioxygenase YbiX
MKLCANVRLLAQGLRQSSVVKRRFGGAVTARRYWQQVKQTLRRGVTYNLYRAVQLGLSSHRSSHRLFKAAAQGFRQSKPT